MLVIINNLLGRYKTSKFITFNWVLIVIQFKCILIMFILNV